VCASGDGASAAADSRAGASSLDAAAATVALLRSELPFPITRDVLGENVKYSFLSPLVSLDGQSDYLEAMAYWRAELPRLGDGWRVRRRPVHAAGGQMRARARGVRCFALRPNLPPEHRVFARPALAPFHAVGDVARVPARRAHAGGALAHAVDRAAARLQPVAGGCGAACSWHRRQGVHVVWCGCASAERIADLRCWRALLPPSPPHPTRAPQPAGVVAVEEDEAASASVVRLTDRLKAAEGQLVRGMAGLEGAPVPEAASAALADALRDLRLGVAESQALAAEVQAAEAEDAAAEAASQGWLGALLVESSTQTAAFDADMAALREELTSRVTGSSTFILDAAGRVISHVDAVDFDDALPGPGAPLTAPLEGQSKDAQAAGAAAEERAMRMSAAQADAIFQFCVAHRLPSSSSWTWRFDVVRQLMWEAFMRDTDIDDEVRPRNASTLRPACTRLSADSPVRTGAPVAHARRLR
jgi:hypothetical protein